MRKYLHLLRATRILIQNGLLRELPKNVWEKLFGKVLYVGLALEIERFRNPRLSRPALTARPIERRDHVLMSAILADRNLPVHERHEAARRLSMLGTGLQTCYVVVDAAGDVRFLQWLVLSAENETLRHHFGDWYPSLSPGEALMENAYMFPKYRGTGILPGAVARVLDFARVSGVNRVVMIIPSWNSNSIASFLKLGFTLYQIRHERRWLGLSRRTTIPVTETTDEQVLRRILPPSIVGLFLKPNSDPL